MGVQLTEDRHGVVGITISPTAIGANTTGEQTFACPGLRTTDAVLVNKPSHQAGMMPIHARVPAPDRVAITFANTSAGSLTPTAAEQYLVYWFRAERVSTSAAG